MKSTLLVLRKALRPALMTALIALVSYLPSQAQSVLFPGDIAITGYITADDSNATQDDAFSFVLLRSIDANTTIFFTDFGWTNAGKFQSAQTCGVSTGSANDGVIRWTSSTTMLCGSQVRINCSRGLTATAGTVAGITPTFNDSLSFLDLTSGGDQVFAFQGSISAPTLISGVSINKNWDADLDTCTFDSQQSMVPAGFSSFAPAILPNAANARFNCSVSTANSSTLRLAISNNGNWFTDNTLAPPVPVGFQLPLPCTISGCTVAGPTVTSQPVDATICEGTNTTFSVTATGANYYQWQVLDTGNTYLNLSDGGPLSGVNTSTLTITNAPYSLTLSRFRCLVSGPGLPSAASASALLLVNPIPVISGQTPSRVHCENDPSAFSVSVTGQSFLNFQWQMNSGSGWVNLTNTPPFSDVDFAAIQISSVPFAFNGYQFRCVVTGSCGTPATSAPVSLFVNRRPQITAEPVDANICIGNNAEFRVSAVGAALTYRWQIDTGLGFTNLAEAIPFFGTGDDTLFIANPPTSLYGARFRCIIDGVCSPTDTSLVRELRMSVNPSALAFSAGPVNYCGASANNLYTVNPVYPTATYVWSYTGSGVTINPISNGVASVTFGPNATSGSLRVIATNSCAQSPLAFRNITVNPVYSLNDTVSICPGDSVSIFGVWRSTPGNYSALFTTAAGCDSTITRTLRLNTTYNFNNTVMLCSGDSVFAGGAWQTASGTFTDNLQTIAGCDSIVNTNLTVHPSYSFNSQANICQGDSIFIQGGWRTTSGIYTDSYQTDLGCDSIIITSLTVDPSPVVTLALDSVVCLPALPLTLSGGSPAGGIWSGTNVTGNVFNTSTIGLYTINYSYTDGNGCSAVATDVIDVRTCAGLAEFDAQGISIYPIPTNNILYINFSRNLAQDASYIITDVNGRLVADARIVTPQTQVAVDHLENGVYFLTLLNDGIRMTGRIVLVD